MKIDIHQHLWTEPLVRALARREELPFVRYEHGLTVLFLAGERPYVIDLDGEEPAHRAALVQRDGLDRALLCLSSPLGIESLARAQALPLLDAYHEGALALGDPFGVWGAIALDRADPDDVDRLLDSGCVGISLPAGALAGVEGLARLYPVLARLALRGAPLFVHPGPLAAPPAGEASLGDPLWWPALTRYVAEMQAAWLAFRSAGRNDHPELRVVFSMLAGLAPLHAERLVSRGGPAPGKHDELVFYDTSSYGPAAIGALAEAIGGSGQLLYGSDRPVVEPALLDTYAALDRDLLADATARALGGTWSQSHSRAEAARPPVEAVQPPVAAVRPSLGAERPPVEAVRPPVESGRRSVRTARRVEAVR
jgi:6-methylsalicylate decarboxylase